LRWRGDERSSRGLEPAAEKEHTMIVAFALAIVGAVVLGSLDLVSRVHDHAHSHAHAPAHTH
jgi:hypothetical protein